MTALGREGGADGHIQDIQRLWAPSGDGDLLLIPGEGDIGGRRGLAGGGREFVKGEGIVEEYDEDPHKVEGGAAGVQIFL